MAHNPWQQRGRGQAGDGVAARPPQRALDRHQLRHLLDGVVAVSANLNTRTVLHRIVEAATDLIAARYGALGVLDENGRVIDLITVGIDDPHLCAAMGMPQGHGLLHTMVDDRESLRVADVAAHPRSAGFPPGHPVMRTLLGVPLIVRGAVYGDLYVADKTDGTPFDDDDEGLLTALASAAGVSLENARLYQQLKHAAEHFQRRMLPVLPDLAPLEAAARYEPASELPRLGGDWYDAMVLPDGATYVVVGDVTGHNVEAAPLMGQIRNMLRAIALDRGGPPGLVVSRLDRALTMFTDPPTATLVLGRIERGPEEGGPYTFGWSNAGHLPPLLVGADGSTRYLAPARHGIPVGIEASVPRFSHEQPLPPGSTLLLFTDGLVERRDQDIDTGLADLAEQAAGLATASLEVLCDALISRSRQMFDDDVALLALRTPSHGPAR
ncbi:GAF domain-containing SpoIIE family protein phosphatase [Streptomyces sp. ME19-01-6]|uniref:PP2C family protein-serine/threonine phosphatase n=1 Tax=Streptomyces sp. ME19-01-6 TaxID=3028686 RepID=UPI0029B4089A|nr:GAF domain-containing SpoIIE family protein phosphatase [Streptomyces sp. ME19-01-6]MDX3233623.1 SpoIIE family protein phosphatase [Streptomyces sp. ME19-01-6]